MQTKTKNRSEVNIYRSVTLKGNDMKQFNFFVSNQTVMKKLVLLSFLFFGLNGYSQSLTQSVTGFVLDAESKRPLIGALVQLLEGDSSNATYTDFNGKYTLENVPVGRVSIAFHYTGYESRVYNELTVVSGKQLQLNAELTEEINNIDVVEIQAQKSNEANNDQIVVSDIQLNPEQTGKYAGTLQDVSRMASNYAGIVPAGDQRNDIIIRGNSPLGVLWQLEGINIPNPNHFGNLGNTGGPVSILNNNNLAKSDFMTGAFPAQYGNATAGAFDLQMRSGNFNKMEYTGQIGFNGLEAGIEGPLNKKKNASLMLNYRYSTLGVMDAMNINFGVPAVPQYQDIAFKIDIKSKPNIGRIELFGIGGLSYIELLDSERDPEKWSYTDGGTDTYFGSDMGVIGMQHTIFLSKKTSLKNTIALSGARTSTTQDTLSVIDGSATTWYDDKTTQATYSFNSVLNTKVNKKVLYQFGINADVMQLLLDEKFLNTQGTWEQDTEFNGFATLLQSYGQLQYKWNKSITTNIGIHQQYFTLNNQNVFEPRLGTTFKLSPKHSINLGAGIHNQTQPLVISLAQTTLENGEEIKTNKDLPFTQSNHVVLGYNYQIANNWRLKVETYYQGITNVPVYDDTYFSLANMGADFGIPQVDSLIPEGTGENYGVELTLEKFYANGYYILLNTSVFDSWYTGGDGVKRRTAFAGNYTSNALAGYEWNINQKYVLDFNIKWTMAGGRRYIPINLERSKEEGEARYNIDEAFENRYQDYRRFDIKVGLRQNNKKYTQEWAIDLQNLTNRQNIFQESYNAEEEEIVYEYQMGLFPMMTYRIQF